MVSQMVILVVCGLLISSAWGMRQQAVGVKGILMCGPKPASNVQVKLWDEDDGLDPDDELDSMFTKSDGSFEVKGSTRELTTIDPVFKVYHDCNDLLPGQRKAKFVIPNNYITDGSEPKRIFDIGVLNLETKFLAEERDII